MGTSKRIRIRMGGNYGLDVPTIDMNINAKYARVPLDSCRPNPLENTVLVDPSVVARNMEEVSRLGLDMSQLPDYKKPYGQ